MESKEKGSPKEAGDDKRAAYLRKRLMERYHRLLKKAWGIEGLDVEFDPGRNATPRILVDTFEEEVTHQVAEMRLEEIQEIEEALRKLSEGEYGMCEDCGEAIPASRLRAIPSALFCVQCQERREWRRRVERAREQSADGAYTSLAMAMAQITGD